MRSCAEQLPRGLLTLSQKWQRFFGNAKTILVAVFRFGKIFGEFSAGHFHDFGPVNSVGLGLGF